VAASAAASGCGGGGGGGGGGAIEPTRRSASRVESISTQQGNSPAAVEDPDLDLGWIEKISELAGLNLSQTSVQDFASALYHKMKAEILQRNHAALALENGSKSKSNGKQGNNGSADASVEEEEEEESSEEEDLKCRGCGREFARKSGLSNHIYKSICGYPAETEREGALRSEQLTRLIKSRKLDKRRIEVWWAGDETWFAGKVTKCVSSSNGPIFPLFFL